MAASTPLGLTDWLSFAASFVLVLLLIGFLFFLLRRLGGGSLRAGNDKQISVLETQAMGNRQRIVLVRAKDREILLGMSMQQISTLAIWSPEELAKAGVSADMVRLSIGIEHIDDLKADLDQALANA